MSHPNDTPTKAEVAEATNHALDAEDATAALRFLLQDPDIARDYHAALGHRVGVFTVDTSAKIVEVV